MKARLLTTFALVLTLSSTARTEDSSVKPASENTDKKEDATVRRKAVSKGLDWLLANQAENGSWGKVYTVAVTSFSSTTWRFVRVDGRYDRLTEIAASLRSSQ